MASKPCGPEQQVLMPEPVSIRRCKSSLFKDGEEVFSSKYILNTKTEEGGREGVGHDSCKCQTRFPSLCKLELVDVVYVTRKQLALSHCHSCVSLFHYEGRHREDHTPHTAKSYSSNFQILMFKSHRHGCCFRISTQFLIVTGAAKYRQLKS